MIVRPAAAPAAHVAPRRRGRPLAVYFGVIVALLYLPLAILFVFSVNDSPTVSFPLSGLTLDWYVRVLTTPALLNAIWSSAVVAAGSSIVATALGTMLALLMVRFEFRTKRLLAALALTPLIVPYVVLAVALLVLFRGLGVPLSLVTVGIAHAVIALPFTTLIVTSRLIGLGVDVEEAAQDLGATYPQALRLVTLPIIAPAIVSAWLVAFTVSFDEFALALFLAGREPTFPVYLFGQLRFTATLPALIAAAVLTMAASLAVIMLAERIRRGR